jgi:hypothetical protein
MSEQIEQIGKAELISTIGMERKRLENLLAQVPQHRMAEPCVEGPWSVKDILIHLIAWEQRMIYWLGQALHGEIPDMPSTEADLDCWNERIYQENRDRLLEDVLINFYRSYSEALIAVEATPEEDLVDPSRYPWRQGAPLWQMVASNTFWHYQEHGMSIQAWVGKTAET